MVPNSHLSGATLENQDTFGGHQGVRIIQVPLYFKPAQDRTGELSLHLNYEDIFNMQWIEMMLRTMVCITHVTEYTDLNHRDCTVYTYLNTYVYRTTSDHSVWQTRQDKCSNIMQHITTLAIPRTYVGTVVERGMISRTTALLDEMSIRNLNGL